MKCLLIEDDEDLRHVMQALIELNGAGCLAAASIEPAAMLLEQDSDITHMLTDWNIKGRTASALLEAALRTRPEIALAIYSGSNEADLDLKGISEEKFAFFRKPMGLAQLADWLTR